MTRILPGFLALLVILAACSGGGTGGSPGASDDGDGDGGTEAIEHPTGADEAVFTIEFAGGFVPVEFAATALPSFVLLGDGRVIMQGPQTLIYPGPALPPLMERTLTEEGIQELLALIVDTNLFDSDLELRGAESMVADASDTIFTLNAGGRTATVSVYGLGTLAPMPGMEAPQGVSEAEMQAHAILQQLNDQMLALDSELSPDAWEDDAWRPYAPDAFRLYVRDVTDEPIEGADVPPTMREWPTEASRNPAEFGEEERAFGDGTRCGVVEGDEAAAWLGELSAANQLTQWTDEADRRFSVAARPLLPHEERTCTQVVGA